jgi:hypothetical protein
MFAEYTGRYPRIVPTLSVDDGIAAKDVLRETNLPEAELHSPAVRVSANQIIQSYWNAMRLSRVSSGPACQRGVSSNGNTPTFAR